MSSNVELDDDSLMPLIKELIKPPDEGSNSQKPKKPQHPYYKRPGKGHNHDSCDACGEGGDLICCDRCPASFHLGCYDPPLEENDIPHGQWLCRQCKSTEVDTSAKSSRATSPVDGKSGDKKARTLRTNRASSAKKKVKETQPIEDKTLEDTKPTPMELLVTAARTMNPKQFELPPDIQRPCPFPGTDRDNGSNVVMADGGPAALAASCHACGGSCRVAPLLRCDYCPLHYHQDCLDPPLTALPTGRWMCPNHVEQYIDWKMVNSVSASERVALWDQFSGPVDQHAIKIDFIRSARRQYPLFRCKVPAGIRGRVHVPGIVRHHYRKPAPLLPTRREFVRCRRVLKHLGAERISDEENVKKSLYKICLNPDCAKYGNGACPHDDPKIAEAISVADGGEDGERTTDELVAVADSHLSRLDSKLVKLLAWQRLEQIVAGEECAGAWRRLPPPPSIELSALRSLPPPPASLHPSELVGRTERRAIASAAWAAAPADTQRVPVEEPESAAFKGVAIRAVVLPVKGVDLEVQMGKSVAMRLSRLSVGADGACDVVLDATRCRCVSPTHAVIFYDEVTGQYELLNYSEWGSRVNGVLYANDTRCAAPPPPAPVLPPPLTPRLRGRLVGLDSECTCPPTPPLESAAWEGSALVPHGALLQFGCCAYVFSILWAPTFPYHEEVEDPAL